MTPAAIAKGESLARYVQAQGAPLDTFVLALTLGEGYELLDYVEAGGLGLFANQALLLEDIRRSREAKDPFLFLAFFQLSGLSIARADLVLN